MKSNAFVITATSVAILSSSVWSLPANAVPAAAPTVAPTTLVKTVRVDVDGDGKSDTVQLISQGGSQFQLKVTTKKTSATVAFTSVLDSPDTPAGAWYGAAKLDAVMGNELIVRVTKPDTGGDLAVYTWRKGRLVAAKAPAAPTRAGWWVSDLHGFRFYTSAGRHYAAVAQIDSASRSGIHKAQIVRSVWRNGKWVKFSSKKVKLNEAAIRHYHGIEAPSVLTGQAKVDVDGDGLLDSASMRRLPGDYWALKIVTAKGKVLTRTQSPKRDDGELIGFATLDGVPGAELIFNGDGDSYTYDVLTWRKGKLVTSPSPEGRKDWMQSTEGSRESYEFSTVNRQRQLVTNWRTESVTVEFVRYAWVTAKWVKQEAWSADLDDAAMQALCRGFCGVDMTRL